MVYECRSLENRVVPTLIVNGARVGAANFPIETRGWQARLQVPFRASANFNHGSIVIMNRALLLFQKSQGVNLYVKSWSASYYD